MLDRILSILGYKVTYVCDWGEYDFRYDYLDHVQSRPIHKDMSVAPPWAKRKISRE